MVKFTEAQHVSEETHWEKAARTRLGKYLTQIETNFIKDSLDLSRAEAIMDVGAEAGRFSRMSANPDTIIVSLDIDSYGLKRLKHKTRNVNVIQADARNIPLKDGTFDVIFMIEVLDYIPQLDRALSECHRTLKLGASLILSFGNKSSLKSKIRELGGKSYQHSHGQVMRSLQRARFSVKRKTGYNWLPLGRMSQSRFIPFLAWAERVFGLRRIPSLSPWVLIKAAKT